jgi:hypothetical protein
VRARRVRTSSRPKFSISHSPKRIGLAIIRAWAAYSSRSESIAAAVV